MNFSRIIKNIRLIDKNLNYIKINYKLFNNISNLVLDTIL